MKIPKFLKKTLATIPVWLIITLLGTSTTAFAVWISFWSNTQEYDVTSTPEIVFSDDFTTVISLDTTHDTQNDTRTAQITNQNSGFQSFVITATLDSVDVATDECTDYLNDCELTCWDTTYGSALGGTGNCVGGTIGVDGGNSKDVLFFVSCQPLSCPQDLTINAQIQSE